MEVSFLGSANAFAAEGRYWSSFIVDGKYQFDAPPTLLPQLKRLGVSLPEIEVIFITHFHGDHFVGLPFLLLEYTYMTPRTKDLYIVGPPGCEAVLEDFAHRVYPNIIKDAGYRRIYMDAEPGKQQKGRLGHLHLLPDEPRQEGRPPRPGLPRPDRRQDPRLHRRHDDVRRSGPARRRRRRLRRRLHLLRRLRPEHMGLDDIKVIRRRISPETTMILTHLDAKPSVNGLANTLVAEDLKTFHFD